MVRSIGWVAENWPNKATRASLEKVVVFVAWHVECESWLSDGTQYATFSLRQLADELGSKPGTVGEWVGKLCLACTQSERGHQDCMELLSKGVKPILSREWTSDRRGRVSVYRLEGIAPFVSVVEPKPVRQNPGERGTGKAGLPVPQKREPVPQNRKTVPQNPEKCGPSTPLSIYELRGSEVVEAYVGIRESFPMPPGRQVNGVNNAIARLLEQGFEAKEIVRTARRCANEWKAGASESALALLESSEFISLLCHESGEANSPSKPAHK